MCDVTKKMLTSTRTTGTKKKTPAARRVQEIRAIVKRLTDLFDIDDVCVREPQTTNLGEGFTFSLG